VLFATLHYSGLKSLLWSQTKIKINFENFAEMLDGFNFEKRCLNFFKENFKIFLYRNGNSPLGNSPHKRKLKVRQFTAEQVHRKLFTTGNSPQRQFTARQFTAKTIHRKQFTTIKFKK
jgi:hypothetical protein